MTENLPKRHPSAHREPLEAENQRKAIGVTESNGIALAIGDDTVSGEWIRMEGETVEVKQ